MPYNRSMRLQHLHGRKTAGLVLRRGRTWKGRAMVIRWIPGSPRVARKAKGGPSPSGFFVGTFASTKLSKKAVERNRMRRRCREALRRIVHEREDLPAVQLLLCPRSASLRSPFPVLQEDVRAFLSTLR